VTRPDASLAAPPPGDPTALSIAEAGAALARGELSCVELTEAHLERIAATEPELNAYVTVTAEAAREQAERAQRRLASGAGAGPLCGIPLGLKDLYDVRGVPTRAGSPLLGDPVAGGDSTVAARLRAAGAVLLGKQATHEFAWGGTTNNPHFGPTRNPHDPARVPGGSSGGSGASVVAGSCAGAFGTDTCGSVRIPAALSGCVGLKPTYGRISLHRVVPLSVSLDHAGPLARTVRDAALLYSAVAGFDAADARTLPVEVADVLGGLGGDVRGLRVGRLRGWFEDVLDPDVRTAVDRAAGALRDAGTTVTDVAPAGRGAPVDDVFAVVAADAVPWHWATFGRDNPGYSPALAAVIGAGPPDAEGLATAREAVGEQVAALIAALRDVDVLLCATVPAPAPRIGAEQVVVDGHELHVEWMLTRLTSVFDAARLPALSVPFGRSRDGLPIGVQLIGRHLDEATVLRVGSRLERALDGAAVA
jgi:aspartyl-tRNA(Asn)/glutamyl-tRNA(Gln) amidotransferase subunit A